MSETETKKQPIVDVNHQRKMNSAREHRRDVVHAGMFQAQKNANAAGTPGIPAFFNCDDVRKLVPHAHQHTIESFVGDAFEQKWITTGTDAIGLSDPNVFMITPQGSGVFNAAYAKVGSDLTAAPIPSAAATTSSSAKPNR